MSLEPELGAIDGEDRPTARRAFSVGVEDHWSRTRLSRDKALS